MILKSGFAGMLLFMLCVSCNKKELAVLDEGKVVKLTVKGNSTEQLEFIYKDEVIAETKTLPAFELNTLLSVDEKDAEIKIRKKGSTETLKSKLISASSYNQDLTVYYDGNKIYDNSVTLLIKGYALSGELELLVDGTMLLSGTGIIENGSGTVILMDKGMTRELQIRKKGESTALLTRTIEVLPARQPVSFFFDGKAIVDNVKLDPPADPANMMVKAKFETQWPANFKGVDVELVLYTKDPRTNAAAVKTSPEIRFTLFKDGSFNSIELPPIPANYIYSYDIVEKGTDQVPYVNLAPPILTNGFPFAPNMGRYGELKFEAGKSKLILMRDSRNLVASPARATLLSGTGTDLSQYFQ